MDFVQDRTVTVHHDTYHLVTERQRIGRTDDGRSLGGQLLDISRQLDEVEEKMQELAKLLSREEAY